MAGPLHGARIVTSWHDYPGAITGRTERPLLRWFEQHVKPGQTWLDVGAHYGYTAIALGRLVREAGRVFAFEPVVATAGCVARTVRLNALTGVTVIPHALGSPASLTRQQAPSTRGMIDSTLSGADGTSDVHGATPGEDMLVCRFDWLWPLICSEQPRVDGVKIDVQGMELEVLRGMVETLAVQTPPLVVELHKGVDRNQLRSLLHSLGYSVDPLAIEAEGGESAGELQDDRSYVFSRAE